jgi:hypothetical protein
LSTASGQLLSNLLFVVRIKLVVIWWQAVRKGSLLASLSQKECVSELEFPNAELVLCVRRSLGDKHPPMQDLCLQKVDGPYKIKEELVLVACFGIAKIWKKETVCPPNGGAPILLYVKIACLSPYSVICICKYIAATKTRKNAKIKTTEDTIQVQMLPSVLLCISSV